MIPSVCPLKFKQYQNLVIAMKFNVFIHDSQMLNPFEFGDMMTCSVVALWEQRLFIYLFFRFFMFGFWVFRSCVEFLMKIMSALLALYSLVVNLGCAQVGLPVYESWVTALSTSNWLCLSEFLSPLHLCWWTNVPPGFLDLGFQTSSQWGALTLILNSGISRITDAVADMSSLGSVMVVMVDGENHFVTSASVSSDGPSSVSWGSRIQGFAGIALIETFYLLINLRSLWTHSTYSLKLLVTALYMRPKERERNMRERRKVCFSLLKNIFSSGFK